VTGISENGLDWSPFETLSAGLHGWGAEALVANFTDDGLLAFQARLQAGGLEVASLSLEEIFVALVGRGGSAS
jgi:hypothetical protein